MADISNLDQENRLFARDDRRRMFNLGNLLWHSDSSFRAVPVHQGPVAEIEQVV